MKKKSEKEKQYVDNDTNINNDTAVASDMASKVPESAENAGGSLIRESVATMEAGGKAPSASNASNKSNTLVKEKSSTKFTRRSWLKKTNIKEYAKKADEKCIEHGGHFLDFNWLPLAFKHQDRSVSSFGLEKRPYS